MAKIRDRAFTVRLTQSEYEQLEAIATDIGKPAAVLARECIESYLLLDEPAKALYRLSKPKRSYRQQLKASA